MEIQQAIKEIEALKKPLPLLTELFDTAITALKQQQEHCGECDAKSRALTVEELQDRDRCAVWVERKYKENQQEEDFDIRCDGWHVVRTINGITSVRYHAEDKKYSQNYYLHEYGFTWLAYDRQPKEE